MVSVLILALSAIALVRFAIHQWRVIWISAANQPLSYSLHTASGIDAEAIGPHDFSSLLGLYDQMCPGQRTSTPWLREIARYYRVVSALQTPFRTILPPLSAWATTEMKTCSRYVAVVLDQHLSADLDRGASIRSS